MALVLIAVVTFHTQAVVEAGCVVPFFLKKSLDL